MIFPLKVFESCIGGRFSHVDTLNSVMSILTKVHILKGQSRKTLKNFAKNLSVVEFKSGETICSQNEVSSQTWIIKKGKVDIIINGIRVRTLNNLDYFGERSSILNTPRTADCIANGHVVCFEFTSELFRSVLNENSFEVLKRRILLQDDQVTFADLELIQLLGKGMSANVFQVQSRTRDKHHYALKAISRRKVAYFAIEDSLNNEKEALSNIDHPMILKLVKTYKDPERVYFLTELVAGTELFDVL